ncbi:MAG: hypothetical protein KI790_18985 [Cyclobacteriaceae bacterium]|nr:hypothetical protein [Cyclobacteriaceae bacterium HetDA_MAG_MS6]
MVEDRSCPECGRPVHGRTDKKFCTDACRNAFNNKQNSDAVNYVRNVNNILRKNRRILEEMNPGGKLKTHRDKLLKKGFDFSYFTNIYQTKAGDQYHFCYEQGYLELSEGFVLLVKRNDD